MTAPGHKGWHPREENRPEKPKLLLCEDMREDIMTMIKPCLCPNRRYP